jgi:hypothetical protein
MPAYQNLFTRVQAVGPAHDGPALPPGNSPRSGKPLFVYWFGLLGNAQLGPIYLGGLGIASLILGTLAINIMGFNMLAQVNWSPIEFIRQLPWLALEPPPPGYGLKLPPMNQGGWWLLSGGLLTIDGVALAAGDRVLVKNQSLATENGVYVVSAGAWVRAADANTSALLVPGFVTVAVEGATQRGGWTFQNPANPILGQTGTGLAFVPVSATLTYDPAQAATTASAEEIPRGMAFLFSLNRTNVAISRAMALALVFGSPRLRQASCGTVIDMRRVNALCALAEVDLENKHARRRKYEMYSM